MYFNYPTPKQLSICLCILLAQCLNGQETNPVTEEEVLTDASENALISQRENVEVVADSDVAEAISRRPDLQFNNVTIDGERSNTSLDDIPADAINELEVLRAVTPDLDADSRGGSLNLSSNPSFNLDEPVLKADLGYTYSEFEGTWEHESSMTYGQALKNLGFRITISQENGHDVSEDLYFEWEEINNEETVYTPTYTNYNFSNSWEKSYSVNGSLDYKFSDSFYMFLRATYKDRQYEAHQPNIIYKFYKGDPLEISNKNGTRLEAQIDRDLTVWESDFITSEFQLGGVYEIENLNIDFRYLAEHKKYVEPDWTIIQFRQQDALLEYEIDNNFRPQLTNKEIDMPENFQFDEYLSELWRDKNNKQLATINAKYDFEINNFRFYLKGGMKITDREKDQFSDSRIYTHPNSELTLNTIGVKTNFDSLLMDGFNYGSFPTRNGTRQFLKEKVNPDWYNLKRSAQKGHPATFNANERINASYLMLNTNYKKVRSILGLRLEKTELDYLANEVEIDQNGDYVGTRARTGSNSYENLFPSFHLRYFLGNKMTIIGSWTSTIKRPFYGDVVPYRYINYDSKFISEGTPSLSPTTFENWDLSIDYKLSESSLFSMEFFKKEVEDIVYWEVENIDSGLYEGFTLGSHKNGPGAKEKGVRFILTQQLEEWLDLLEGFSVIVKVTFQDSETEYPGRSNVVLPVTYRPSNIFETTLTYDKDAFFAQLTYQTHSRELQSVYSEEWEDVYQDGRDCLDLTTSYQINNQFRLFFNVDNILKQQSTNFYGEPSRPNKTRWRSRKFEFGLKFSL